MRYAFVQKRVARKDRLPFPVHLMIGRLSAAEIVVVHGGQIVVYQRIGMVSSNASAKFDTSAIFPPSICADANMSAGRTRLPPTCKL